MPSTVPINGSPVCSQEALSIWSCACGIRWCSPPGKAGKKRLVQSIVESSTSQEDEKPEDLQAMEDLPAHSQADDPDDHSAQAVQHHPGGGTDLLGDADAGKVEEGDAADVAQQGHSNEREAAYLAEGIKGIFQRPPRVAAEAAPRDVVQGHQEQGEDDKPKESCGKKAEFRSNLGHRIKQNSYKKTRPGSCNLAGIHDT